MWWAFVTMTTVGYGDIVPVTSMGKIIGAITIVCGILLIALPVAIVGSKFQEVYMEAEVDAFFVSVFRIFSVDRLSSSLA